MVEKELRWSQEEKDLLYTWVQSNTYQPIREALQSVRYVLYDDKTFKSPFRSVRSVTSKYYLEVNKRKKEGDNRRGKITPEIFKQKLLNQNSGYKNGDFELISDYEYDGIPLIIKNKYGLLKVRSRSLLKNGVPSISQAVNKSDYLLNEIKHLNPKILRYILNLEYIKEKAYVTTKYGVIITDRQSILKTKGFSSKNAVNKREYWLNVVKEKRSDYLNIDYSKVKYRKTSDKEKFTCKIHDYEYEQCLQSHMDGKQGCPHCHNEKNIVYNDENFEKHSDLSTAVGFLYVIKLESEDEVFYKVGITRKQSVDQRFKEIKKNYKITIEYADKDFMYNNFKTEQLFLKDFESYKYIPKNRFGGYTECLSVNPLDFYYNEYNY